MLFIGILNIFSYSSIVFLVSLNPFLLPNCRDGVLAIGCVHHNHCGWWHTRARSALRTPRCARFPHPQAPPRCHRVSTLNLK